MAKIVMKDAFIEVDGVEFSSHVSEVEISLKKDAVDTTNFGGLGKESTHGLSEDVFSVTLQQDFDADMVDETLYPLYATDGEEFLVRVRPRSGAVSETNPEYYGTCKLFEYQPLSGKPGDLSETKVEFPSQRAGILRSTTPGESTGESETESE